MLICFGWLLYYDVKYGFKFTYSLLTIQLSLPFIEKSIFSIDTRGQIFICVINMEFSQLVYLFTASKNMLSFFYQVSKASSHWWHTWCLLSETSHIILYHICTYSASTLPYCSIFISLSFFFFNSERSHVCYSSVTFILRADIMQVPVFLN